MSGAVRIWTEAEAVFAGDVFHAPECDGGGDWRVETHAEPASWLGVDLVCFAATELGTGKQVRWLFRPVDALQITPEYAAR